jgi:hypothetical protein
MTLTLKDNVSFTAHSLTEILQPIEDDNQKKFILADISLRIEYANPLSDGFLATLDFSEFDIDGRHYAGFKMTSAEQQVTDNLETIVTTIGLHKTVM